MTGWRDLARAALAATCLAAPARAEQDAAPRPVPPQALDLIAAFEGFEARPYTDPAGNCVIGYGHLIAPSPCASSAGDPFAGGVSEAEARALLAADAADAGREVEALAGAELTDAQYGALTSFVFNFGAAALAGSTLLAHVRAGAHHAAAAEFGKWVLARDPTTGKRAALPGLVARRACEAALYRGERLDPTACGGAR